MKPVLLLCFMVFFTCSCIAGATISIMWADQYFQLVKSHKAPNVINLHSEKSVYMDVHGKEFNVNSGVTK